MRTVGLFTIYICNYGAVLQAYALKKCIENKFENVKVSVVDFYSYGHYRIFYTSARNPIKKLIKYGLILTHYPALYKRNKSEKQFIIEEFNLSDRFPNIDTLLKEMPIFDYYLTGSDQVFNLNSKYSLLFFQQFQIKSGIKAAYAPSFGRSTFSEAEKKEVEELTKDFNYISCRENDGAKMLSEILKKEVPCVIDPTFLLSSDLWSEMMKIPKTNEKYLLVYDLNGGIPMLNIARKVAAEKELKIYCITRHPDISFIYKGIDKVIFDAGPREFVGYFSKASYVITDSFHGTAFSLIFRKNFNTYIAVPKSSQRIKSLLKVCNLQKRIVEGSNSIDSSENCIKLFNESAFAKYKQSSMDYLSEIFK
ncbi:polysaccharide pyruvyl transferase family protein [Parabacteroides merdae]|uniref:polysaccharide pyruvyl transferase family protein n=1 Tax=Parabacteroides merdae TaxID=46503 RepID=UPI000EE315FE|nr:polysaccharide pyruvyl transferase family protein [Parabacteroides merdae]RGM98411.1 polysaccharide pyruvyl transferase family protein [Parabacteroides merdae]